jgi:hypothetical protein
MRSHGTAFLMPEICLSSRAGVIIFAERYESRLVCLILNAYYSSKTISGI